MAHPYTLAASSSLAWPLATEVALTFQIAFEVLRLDDTCQLKRERVTVTSVVSGTAWLP